MRVPSLGIVRQRRLFVIALFNAVQPFLEILPLLPRRIRETTHSLDGLHCHPAAGYHRTLESPELLPADNQLHGSALLSAGGHQIADMHCKTCRCDGTQKKSQKCFHAFTSGFL